MIRSNVDSLPPEFTEFTLPSGGLPYRNNFPDFPSVARVGSFTFKTECILTTNMDLMEKMARITRDVFQNLPPNFPIDDLLEEDQMVVMALARGQTYGESYIFATVCPSCKHRESHEMKIPEQLPVVNWKFDSLEKLEEHLTVALPYSKDVVRLRPITVGMGKKSVKGNEPANAPAEGEAAPAEAKPRSSKSAIVKATAVAAAPDKVSLSDLPKEASDFLFGVARRIESVNGTTPDSLQEAADWLLRLSGRDRVAIEEHRVKTACGINYDIPVKCDNCANQFTAFLPIASSFFRRGQ